MGGYGGKAILIDVEDSRIVVVNTIHFNHDRYKYNVKKLLINPIHAFLLFLLLCACSVYNINKTGMIL